MKPIKAVSLFSGAGGMDVGFENAGVSVVFANELVKEASETYRINHPETKLVNDDINNIMDCFTQYYGVDLGGRRIIKKGFSVAGKMNPDDDRSKLIFSFLKVVSIVQPRMFIMENVKALGKLEKWKSVRERFLDEARFIGYNCEIYLLNATEYGVPQKRERVFFIGLKGCDDKTFGATMHQLLHSQINAAPCVREVLKDLGRAGTERNPNTCTAKITFATNPIMRKSPYAGMYFNGQGRPINVDEYANTLPASMGGNKTPFVDEEYLYGNANQDWVTQYHKSLENSSTKPKFQEAPKRLRRITIKEAAKIQTFPDDYIFCGNKGRIYTQIGNAVPCKLAEAVAKAVMQYLDRKK